MLQIRKNETFGLCSAERTFENSVPSSRTWRCSTLGENSNPPDEYRISRLSPNSILVHSISAVSPMCEPNEIDPLYLFACHIAWERHEDPGAAWELISASQHGNSNIRAQARALLCSSRHLGGTGLGTNADFNIPKKSRITAEDEMKGPYGLDVIDNCTECPSQKVGSFCEFPQAVLQSLDQVSHKTTLPAGAILFVEGQTPRGVFIVCSGRINLSTTSREGKSLIVKTAEAGEVLGLSATVSGTGYETTAETAIPCQVSFIDRKHYLELMELHPEVGLHTARCLSRDYQSAYRDIHDLVLTRSSAGKLARLLLSQAVHQASEGGEDRAAVPMTHEEMAHRIGASRETVTRLLSNLRKKRLIRLDGPTLVIRDRSALEALAV